MSNEVELYSVEDLPVFQNHPYADAEEARACPRGTMRLVQNLESGLIYNAAFRPELLVYDGQYQNEQALSPTFRVHLEKVADLVERTMGRERLVEVGCGKGFFLETMISRGVDITGFDPAYEGNSPFIKKEFFRPDSGMEGEGLVLRHVLEHICDPVDFLRSLAKSNGGRGLIYIEVPCFDWILEHRTWYDIFYEHVNYFRLSDFSRIFGNVIDSGRLFGGQYLYAIADLNSIRTPVVDPDGRCSFPDDFLDSLQSYTPKANSAIWGASSKGVIFSLMMQRRGGKTPIVIDINPAKQGKFLPASGIQVSSPEGALPNLPAGSTIYVMNSNYMEEIKQMSNNEYHYVSVDNE